MSNVHTWNVGDLAFTKGYFTGFTKVKIVGRRNSGELVVKVTERSNRFHKLGSVMIESACDVILREQRKVSNGKYQVVWMERDASNLPVVNA